MRAVHDVSAVRAAEALLMATLPEGELMQRAAAGLARTCAEVMGGCYGSRVVLLVGSGNNGGDALFAGARLARRGARVDALLVHGRGLPAGVVALRDSGGRVHELTGDAVDDHVERLVADADLVVDGILGIGGRGELDGLAASLAALATESWAAVVAVDLPSGVDADTGSAPGPAVWADVTVTFGTLKPGLVVTPGALHVGMLEVVDIGLAPHLPPAHTHLLDADDVVQAIPHPHPADHKYSRGVVGVAAGSDRYPGAAVLTAGGALHAKAGLVRYAGPCARQVVAAWPPVVVTTERPADAGRVDGWVVGPGIGLDDQAREWLAEVLAQPVPVVVDADGLTLLAESPGALADRRAPVVLTPHEGELARLAPDLDPHSDRLATARAVAERLGATVLLKGFTTVVASPGGDVLVNPSGTPWLASGGTGDVLSGVVGAYLAAGLDPLLAAGAAAFVHGVAGSLAASGATASAVAVIDALPGAVRTLSDHTGVRD